MISTKILLSSAVVASLIIFMSSEVLSAPVKKKLEIIIGGKNYCKDNKDCSGDSFCHMGSHICIACPKPFEWVGGTQCVCPDGTVPNAENTDCVECLDDSNCRTLKGDTSWYCDTGSNVCINCPSPKEWHPETNTCECPASTYADGNTCLCDNKNKTLKDGLCQCQIEQKNCSSSDFMGEINCSCCPADKPVWNGASGELADCKSCSKIDVSKPYYNPTTHTCEECLENSHCKNEAVCTSENTCVCELTQADCLNSDVNNIDCMCCPTDKPVWDGEKCVSCMSLQPVYNTTFHRCTCDESLGYAPELDNGKCTCRDKIIVPQQAIFARPTGCYEKELISGPIGPYMCAYDIYVKGHIDDDFLIMDDKGNVLLPSIGSHHHMVDGIIYRLQPGTQIYIYAQDNFCNIIAWERDYHSSENRVPVVGTLELYLVK